MGYQGFGGIAVRADLLKAWGLDVPETLDDWENVFARAKQEGYSKPFTCFSNPFGITSNVHTFNTAYDVGKKSYIEEMSREKHLNASAIV